MIICVALISAAIGIFVHAQIVNRFLYAGATSPQTAKHLKDMALTHSILMKGLIYHAIVKEAERDTYYLDLDRKYEYDTSKSKIAIVVAAVILLLAIIILLFIHP